VGERRGWEIHKAGNCNGDRQSGMVRMWAILGLARDAKSRDGARAQVAYLCWRFAVVRFASMSTFGESNPVCRHVKHDKQQHNKHGIRRFWVVITSSKTILFASYGLASSKTGLQNLGPIMNMFTADWMHVPKLACISVSLVTSSTIF
jgi:hypothetical protein